MKLFKIKSFVLRAALASALAIFSAPMFALGQTGGVERYGLYIGSNDGGKTTSAFCTREATQSHSKK